MSVHVVSEIFAILAVVGQALLVLLVLLALFASLSWDGLLRSLRFFIWGYELWLGFLVAAIATGGSLYFSQVAGFIPCELCWFQRICMYPLSITLLLAALANDRRIVRYLVPLPIVGFCISLYHITVENHWVKTPAQCQIGAGCTVKWINEFGYLTIPTLAATAFAMIIVLFLFVLFSPRADDLEAGEGAVEENPGAEAPQEGAKSGPSPGETAATSGEDR